MGMTASKATASVEKKLIEQTIKEGCVVIFAKSTCGYSLMAIETFDKLKVPYCKFFLDGRDDAEKIQEELKKMTGASSVPRVFINGSFVGGGSETTELFEAGKLMDMVKKCDPRSLTSSCPSANLGGGRGDGLGRR